MKCMQFETVLTDIAEFALLMDALKRKADYFRALLNKNQLFCL